MSEFEEQMDAVEMICPYCKDAYQPESEDYSEDPSVIECDNCGKKYRGWQSFSVDHCADPDCSLNGENHKWQTYGFVDGTSRDFCDICGQIRI